MAGPLPQLPGPLTRKLSNFRVVQYPTENVPQQAAPLLTHHLFPNQRTPGGDTCVPLFHCHLCAPGQPHFQHTPWGQPSKHSACLSGVLPDLVPSRFPQSLSHMQTSSVLGPSLPSSAAAWFPVTLAPCALQMVSPKGPRITPGSSVVKIHPEPSPIPGTLPHHTHLLPLQPCSL